MRKIILLCYLLIYSLHISANDQNDLDQIRNLIATDLESSKDLALSLREKSINNSNQEVLFRVNYLLGYIYKEEGDFGKAVIYYLEAIRYAENSGNPELYSDLSSLYNRCGIIFRQFNSYELSEEYYKKSTEYSSLIGDTVSYIRTQYNVSSLLRDQGKHISSIRTLQEIKNLTSNNSRKYFEILNRLSMTYYELEEYELSQYYSNKLLNECFDQLKLIAYSNHILAKIEIQENNFEKANEYLIKGYDILVNSQENYQVGKKSTFEILTDLGISAYKSGDIPATMKYYSQAEGLIPEITQEVEFFEIYKSLANIHFELSNYGEAKKYEDLYSENLNAYLKLQEEIQETDKRYNMDLITKRYFDEVEKQERIASILLYSKLISGTLLVLLLLSVGYNWYQKTKLRRSIVRELIDLKILD